MPIYYPDILEQKKRPRTFTYSHKDVLLYSLGVGMGRDPMDQRELPFVCEKDIRVLPTAATVLASAGVQRSGPPPSQRPCLRTSELNLGMLVHGEQKIEQHKPLPSFGTFTAATRTIDAYDKGKEKGAVVVDETVWTDENGEKVATLTDSTFARADGGFGGPSQGGPEPHLVPTRKPDVLVSFDTRPDQALLYRLNGDLNPLHSDPDFAKRAGFARPILHGLCTFGITCRAVLQTFCGYDPTMIMSHQARFSAPVFPGDTIMVDLWKDGNVISFEARVIDRGTTVIKNGKTELRSSARAPVASEPFY
ncbi:3-alpha,7-alpha,12-alpha-trihydroxy-5-beta-cholest-24-enoyl-CoA hydratase [Bradyrhizobium canariense]|uniref:3-alpha,7-alpha, 12-alpha-trihydroxy-5-beta-cholest-24-enoyl-CoA hydratase n=1 Tax=Bradyrhizobium canariense TaxID=255045 RepID=A0ABX3XC74_9BRAD|nr:MaoC/PaaZ C-terminal domain-containing protein [Bradyrhizobium canariense]OSJ19698.1 3-alpha,7-alpha,12-alpha-trihydroxy-5-beta-cholest-24-enoyl-CoA hydratase [Bradyrhizobium canariense]OSJ35708.1 3-alpha,7-alpha,12-alpha-trihydroxy-5-beta-cholest-24-enoyl-CoA hydratase [Bradyrhizobium canariense]